MTELLLCSVLLFLICFLLGSIPFGVLISRFAFKTDLRESGSGNIGATNALRVLGKKGGAAVFALDFSKGLLAGFLGASFATLPFLPEALFAWTPEYLHALGCSVAILGAVMGHVFSPWLGFRGGKGIAVTAGTVLSAMGPVVFLIAIGLFAIIVFLTRYVSAGSLGAAAVFLICSLVVMRGMLVPSVLCVLVVILVVWAHRENIKRLLSGTENKLGAQKK